MEGITLQSSETIPAQLEARRGTMTLTELAVMLGISYKTVYKWTRTCALPATKIAGTYWIDPVLVAGWWRNHSTALPKPGRGRK